MSESCRLFLCPRCRSQVILCRRCDRGHVYCLNGCAVTARRESRHEAARRYGRSARGRAVNARRQHQFRQRRRADAAVPIVDEVIDERPELVKVTHQGSPVDGVFALLASPTSVTLSAVIHPDFRRRYCHGCGDNAAQFLRREFLRPHERRRPRPTPPRQPHP